MSIEPVDKSSESKGRRPKLRGGDTRGAHLSPGVALPRSRAAVPDEEQEGDDDHGSHQKDGEDHQDEHMAVLPPYSPDRDLLKTHTHINNSYLPP